MYNIRKFCFLVYTFFSLGIGSAYAQENVLLYFNLTNGAVPRGSLTLSAGKLYGMTYNAGTHDVGIIFSIDTNGNNYKKLLDFNDTNGSNPWYTTLTLNGEKLFGMTGAGGANGDGCIFSIDTNGSRYKDLFDFNSLNGISPLGSLTISGNKLYGMTSRGGTKGDGVIFSVDTSGNGYKKLLDFNDTNGVGPQGGLTLSGSKLFGMASGGGANNDGNIFSIDTNGGDFKVLLNFNGINGALPGGDLTIIGNVLFGTASEGGTNNDGVVFSIDSTGNGYKILLTFNDTNGKFPEGDVTFYNNQLYGTTLTGGAGGGNIFSIDTNGMGYKNLYNFNTNCYSPNGILTPSGNSFYGMTFSGGLPSEYGVVYSFKDTNINTSVNELTSSSEGIRVFPNPSNGLVTLKLSQSANINYVSVFNTFGQQVYETYNHDNNITIDLSGHASGLYLLRVQTGSNSYTKKVSLN